MTLRIIKDLLREVLREIEALRLDVIELKELLSGKSQAEGAKAAPKK